MEEVLQKLKRETKASMKKEQANVGELELQRGNMAALKKTKATWELKIKHGGGATII